MADSINALNGQGMSLQFEKFAQLTAGDCCAAHRLRTSFAGVISAWHSVTQPSESCNL